MWLAAGGGPAWRVTVTSEEQVNTGLQARSWVSGCTISYNHTKIKKMDIAV